MAQRKIVDYHIGYKKFNLKLKDNINLLKKRGDQILKQEMDKFLPVSYREIFGGKYKDISEDVLNAALWIKDKINL